MDIELMANDMAKAMGMQYNQTVVNALINIATAADENARCEMALHMREAIDKFTADLANRMLMHSFDKPSNDNQEYKFGPA